MNVQTLRSACARAKPEVQKTGHALQNYFRDFSTSGSFAEDKASSVRQRSRAATSEINSFVKRGGGHTAAAKTLAFPLASTTQTRVLDVRSLPRGLGTRGRGRGGFGGRGGGQGQIGAAVSPGQRPARTQSPTSSGPGNRFSRPGAAYAGRGGSSLRGGRGGRGGGKGGKGRRTSKDNKNKDDGAKTFGKRQDPFEVMDPYEEQFDRDMRFGTCTIYQPSLTLDSLAAFAPAVPTSAAGRKATVLENLCALGTADPVGAPQELQASGYAADLEAHGVRFFADSKARDAAEQYLQQKQDKAAAEEQGSGGDAKDVIVSGAEESIRKVILEQAVQGEHEKMTFATEPAALSRTWHLRAETWRKSDVDKFERKLKQTLVRGANLAGSRGSAKA
ncbi:hypothetical protein E4U43_007995 [Claviceps pusilla]|uniref:Uncharacterized protein n=1 Tax=Claviceps pusilla TaxID=123648 RepID=A0A9P7SXN5_9HYPO|nr:hypothetical protein E4U43_007995 [Claviceps pusilla]